MKLLRPVPDRPIIYLSGGHTSSTLEAERDWLKRTGCKYRCYSFGYTCPGAFYYNKRMEKSLDVSVKSGVGIMMDSGAFSFHKFVTSASGKISKSKRQSPEMVEKLKDETIEHYIQYCKGHANDWDFYINFDYIKHAPTCYKVQKLLEKHGLHPVPVFHGDESLDWFERYCKEGYKLIGVGTMRTPSRMSWRGTREYYDLLFNMAEKYGVVMHGFAVTALTHMFLYPWYSVDSATWVKVAAFGKIVYIDPVANTIGQIHVSADPSKHKPSYNTMTRPARRALAEQIESHGFSIDKLRTDLWERSTYNAYMFSNQLMHLKDSIRAQRMQWGTVL